MDNVNFLIFIVFTNDKSFISNNNKLLFNPRNIYTIATIITFRNDLIKIAIPKVWGFRTRGLA